MINHGQKPLEFSYDYATDVITIEGLRYSAALFRDFASPFAVGRHVTVVRNDNGDLTLKRIDGCRHAEEDAAANSAEAPKRYWPNDSSSSEALCLRRHHHSPEAGCWLPKPRSERLEEMHAEEA